MGCLWNQPIVDAIADKPVVDEPVVDALADEPIVQAVEARRCLQHENEVAKLKKEIARQQNAHQAELQQFREILRKTKVIEERRQMRKSTIPPPYNGQTALPNMSFSMKSYDRDLEKLNLT